MGLFRRSRREPDPAPTGPGLSDGAGACLAPVQRAAGADTTPAWQALAPLAPTVSAPVPTFKIGAAVKEDLVALDSPRLSHGMGHLAGPDGPPGVVGGLATIAVQRHEDRDDATVPASSDGGAATRSPEGNGDGSADMPVVARTAAGDGNGNDNNELVQPSGTADGGWGALLVPRIVPAGSEVPPEWSSRPVVARPIDAPPRRLPLVPPLPVVQRSGDAEPAGSDGDATALVDPPEIPPDSAHGDGLGGAGTAPQHGDATEPTPIQRAVDGPAEARPRPGALGPPLHSGPASRPGAAPEAPADPAMRTVPIGPVQRNAMDTTDRPPSATHDIDTDSAGTGADPAAMDLAIRQRPRAGRDHAAAPVVARSIDGTEPAGAATAAATGASSEGRPRRSDPAPPVVQRARDADLPAEPDPHGVNDDTVATGTGAGPVTAEQAIDAAGVDDAGDLADRSAAADAAHGDLIGSTTDIEAGALPAHPPSAEPDQQPGGPGESATVRPTLGLDDGITGGDPSPSGASGSPAPGADAPALPLPLPSLQRQPVDGSAGGTTTGSGHGIATPAAALSPAPAAAPAVSPATSLSGPTRHVTSPPAPPVPTLPLVAQRSLVPAPGLGDALAVRAPHPDDHAGARPDTGQAITPLVTWPAPAGPERGTGSPGGIGARSASVQRWPDLGGVTGAGRDALGAASGAARERARALADRGRQAATDRIGDSMPDIPDMPGAGSLPDLDLARPPQLPSAPGVSDMAGLPGLGAVHDLPAMPAMPSAPTLPSLSGPVPMTEITFPSPASTNGGAAAAGGAASPAGVTGAAGTGAAGGPSGGAAAGGDLDELAHKLYDRIRWRMRAELRLDRERAGLGAGVRH